MSLVLDATVVDVLKTSIDPKSNNTLPATPFIRSGFSKRFTVTGNWSIRADGAVAGPVKDSSGVVVWYVNRGIGTIMRYGVVPAGTVAVANPRFNLGSSPGNYVIPNITFNQEFLLPYNIADRSTQVIIDPSLTPNQYSNQTIAPSSVFVPITVGRQYAGQLTLKSDTVPIGNTAITGNFSMGTVEDIRALITSATSGAARPSSLLQQTLVSKDAIQNVSVADGITTILGPDVLPTYQPPYPWFSQGAGINDTRRSLLTALPTSTISMSAGNTNILWGAPFFVNAFPGAISISDTGPFAYTFYDCWMIERVANGCCVRVKLLPPCATWVDSATPNSAAFTFHYTVTHVYARVTNTGAITIVNGAALTGNTVPNSYAPDAYFNAGPFPSPGTSAGTLNSVPTCIEFNAPIGLAKDGSQYLGSVVAIYASCTASTVATTLTCRSGNINFFVEQIDMFGSGNLGPCRVMRWDNVSSGQVMQLNGSLLLQSVPNASIAPIVSPMSNVFSYNIFDNIFIWMQRVFDGNGPFKRNSKISEWQELINVINSQGAEGVLSLLDSEEVEFGKQLGIITLKDIKRIRI